LDFDVLGLTPDISSTALYGVQTKDHGVVAVGDSDAAGGGELALVVDLLVEGLGEGGGRLHNTKKQHQATGEGEKCC